MNTLNAIYTEKARCQDCYRCVRNCPVKAIKIEQGVASVVEELCIHCGKCVNSCPAQAKKVRDDLHILRELFDRKEKVIASLAPSYVSEFSNIGSSSLIAALKSAGFYGVSETALGAQEVSAHAAALLEQGKGNEWYISSACPAVVNYIRKYHPALSSRLTPLLSPLLAHCRMLREKFPDARIVFFGPCIAKKDESAAHADILDAALTFEDMRTLLAEKKVNMEALDTSNETFIPQSAQEGALYPVDGGMIAGIKMNCTVTDNCAMHFSGMDEIVPLIASLESGNVTKPLFLELLACAGGCVNGPLSAAATGTLMKRLAIIEKAPSPQTATPRHPTLNITEGFALEQIGTFRFSDGDIEAVLRETGKYEKKDELNCGGCGYGNCREFAQAVLEKKAEIAMCVTYMRRLALKKANKLIMSMPSGVVIVDKDLKIIECNARFAKLAGEDAVSINERIPGMQGAVLEKVLPVSSLFRHVLDTGEDITGKDITVRNRIMHCTVFSIEPRSITGGIFNDITAPELKKDEIIKRAQTVIRNNLTTVQKIAYLLGENASETEMVLSTIIASFKPDDPGQSHDVDKRFKP